MLTLGIAMAVVLGLVLVFILRGGEKSLPSDVGGIKEFVDRRKPK